MIAQFFLKGEAKLLKFFWLERGQKFILKTEIFRVKVRFDRKSALF